MFNRSTKEKKEKMRSEGIFKIDVLEGLKQIETASQDLIIADPPYYKAINEKWDKQWKTEQEYLDWCKRWFDECVRTLKPTGSFYCYGNFDILSKQKVLIFDKQLNFRQNITLDKGIKSIAGRTSDKLRMFPTASEYLLFYTKQNGSGLADVEKEFVANKNPFAIELKRARIKKGVSINEVAEYGKFYGNVNHGGSVTNWERGYNLPLKEQWDILIDNLPIEKTDYESLRTEYEAIRNEYASFRFTFNLPTATTDIWDFTPDKVRYGHPTQKPQDVCQRIVKASSNENDNVLIPFAGSGSEIVACEELKRNWTAFEIEDSYIEIIKKRLDEFKTKLF